MSIKTMDDLFVATLKDAYYAEKQILKALPGMVKKGLPLLHVGSLRSSFPAIR